MARNNNRKVVPESRHMLNQMKYEIATELGIGSAYGSGGSGTDTEFAGELGEIGGAFAQGGSYAGHLTSRQNGSVGGEMTKRLVRQAQQTLM
ncbi:alpha/beta-type small acid-soluble spore protein [Paenibacillus donghaensis]|uniref:alpha/beta-type small acid-soluble spore protein n=1 Tax=Paenibacillus donghaensis TaxID=414771 RepID=UPI0018841F7A|nr:alpha/beta-type small acid-soluble spore protein [Paenibacillus donghaensis]MBE9916780.1 alpha/beta-type small acid-soluble spore protein [Paenibacillus donghaensis]